MLIPSLTEFFSKALEVQFRVETLDGGDTLTAGTLLNTDDDVGEAGGCFTVLGRHFFEFVLSFFVMFREHLNKIVKNFAHFRVIELLIFAFKLLLSNSSSSSSSTQKHKITNKDKNGYKKIF